MELEPGAPSLPRSAFWRESAEPAPLPPSPAPPPPPPAGAHLGAPGEVAVVQAQRAELGVAAAHAHAAHAHVGRQLGHGGLAAQLIPAAQRGGRGRASGKRRLERALCRQRGSLCFSKRACAARRGAATPSCARPKLVASRPRLRAARLATAHFRFLRHAFCLPPVARRLCRLSREIPAQEGQSKHA